MSPIERERHLAERAAQGLPPHLEDPAVAARVAALLLCITANGSEKAAASVRMPAAAASEVRGAVAAPTE